MSDVNPNYENAITAYHKGDFSFCLDNLRIGIQAGDAGCMTLLGTLYVEGEAGLQQDKRKGIALLEQAVGLHNIEATYVLGNMLYKGISIKRDKKKGLRYIRRAAFMRHIEAQWDLSGVYSAKFKFKRALLWGIVAANNGHEKAIEWVNRFGKVQDTDVKLAEGLLNCIDGIYLMRGIDSNEALKRLAYYETNLFK